MSIPETQNPRSGDRVHHARWRGQRGVLGKQSGERLRGQRAGEIVVLAAVASERLQLLQLLPSLDALADHGQIEISGQRDHATDDRRVLLILAEPAHERPVHLQRVERKTPELPE